MADLWIVKITKEAEAMLAVTGATGQIGGRVAVRLALLGLPQRLIVRDPSRAPRLPEQKFSKFPPMVIR